jgi:SAM-dependent methyltransferase
MNHPAGMTYDAYYFKHECGSPYERNDNWLRFSDGIAQHIRRSINPRSALDAGCAMGFLVEGLRKLDIDAFGIDISEYALARVHPDYAPYCIKASATEPLRRRYDLVISIEVFEHLSTEECLQAVANICRSTDDVLFSSSPFDYQEATHCNVQPPDYWARLFATHGFFRDLDYDASFITTWAVRFRKSSMDIPTLVGCYERCLWRYLQENSGSRKVNLDQRSQLSEYESKVMGLESRLKECDEKLHVRIRKLETELDQSKMQLKEVDERLQLILNRTGWVLLERMGRLRFKIIPRGSWREKQWYRILRFARSLMEIGVGRTLRNACRAITRLSV